MKVEGPKSSSEIAKKKDVKNTSGDGTFQSMVNSGATSDTSQTSGTGLSAGIAGIDALLIAQAAEDPTEGQSKQKMKQRAEDILARLDDLKMAMMTGSITVGHMVSIADVVASHRDTINDPELSAILDEIDLRAHVELAKLQVAQSRL